MAKAGVTAVFSSETYTLCSYFCLSFVFFQGARGPDGPVGEPGSRGVKVNASGWPDWPRLLLTALGRIKVTSSFRNGGCSIHPWGSTSRNESFVHMAL